MVEAVETSDDSQKESKTIMKKIDPLKLASDLERIVGADLWEDIDPSNPLQFLQREALDWAHGRILDAVEHLRRMAAPLKASTRPKTSFCERRYGSGKGSAPSPKTHRQHLYSGQRKPRD